ncbi:MAG: amino acid adenylation domain-containing protein [Pseudomonadota bacterium]|nr:amino acid adenylation domain-containing protein [Pseudomonadota bacterium]
MGYWRNPEQTAARFIVHPQTGQRLYDTGDLGYRDGEGIIHFLGREDTQVKIRGFRIELGEIDKVLEAHPAVNTATSLVLQSHAQHKIVAALVLENPSEFNTESLRQWCQQRLPSYMEPAGYIQLQRMPLTINGKLDRKALSRLFESEAASMEINIRPASTPHEVVLCALVAHELKVEKVLPESNFFHLGGDSIAVVRLVNNLNAVGWSLTPADVFTTPVLAGLAKAQATRAENRLAEDALATAIPTPDQVDLGSHWPLTPLQQGLWFLAHCEPQGDDPYNVQIVVELEGELDQDRLHRALQGVVDRHPSLRVAFASDDLGHGIQVVAEHIRLPFETIDLSTQEPGQQGLFAAQIEAEDRACRFQLQQAPLMRVKCLRFSVTGHRLILSQHHLLGDGWSSAIFFRELYELYRCDGSASSLGKATSLADFLAWRSIHNTEASEKYWRDKFVNFHNQSLIAPNVPRDSIPEVAHCELLLSPQQSLQVTQLARAQSVTEASIMEALWALFVAIVSGAEDVCFGSVGSGREAPVAGIENIIGLLITTIPVRVNVSANRTMAAIVQELHQDRGERLAHQYLSLSEIQKATGTNVLFDSLFTFENYPLQDAPDTTDTASLPVSAIRGSNGNHYPASLAVIPGEKMLLRLHYSAACFEHNEARDWLLRLVGLLSQVINNVNVQVRDLDLLLPTDIGSRSYSKPSSAPNSSIAAQSSTAQFVSLPEQIRKVAQGQLQHPAVSCGSVTLTYAELYNRSCRIADLIQLAGVGMEDRVALIMPRTVNAIAAMLGVWQSNAAFVPIDPATQAERLRSLLQESGVRLILTCTETRTQLPDPGISMVCVDQIVWQKTGALNTRDLEPSTPLHSTIPSANYSTRHSKQLAYIIYTSGSTGQPKGVAVTHRGLPQLARVQAERMAIEPGSRVLQVASFSFDAAISEIAMALVAGAHLVIAEDQQRVGPALTDLLMLRQITHGTLTPTVLLATRPPAGSALRRIISAGEAVTQAALAPWGEKCEIINAYGPTEASVCATMSVPWSSAECLPSIGESIGVTDVLILDSHLRQCPVGVTGEIYLTGPGLARNYINQPGLTASRFLANPFAGAGERMYRTGDLGAWQRDGTVQYQGRNDQQLKIRGHRVEPSEVCAVLTGLDPIREAVVSLGKTPKRDPMLVAYLMVDSNQAEMVALENEQVRLWSQIEAGFGNRNPLSEDPAFETRGWNSSYTGEPLSVSEITEYVDETVARIQQLSPGRLLDIGCGTGLIGFRLLSFLAQYTGTDLALENVQRLQNLQLDPDMQQRFPGLADAGFIHLAADQIAEGLDQRFDTIVLTSVVQYFPSVHYLTRVLCQLADTQLETGGYLFIGDVKSLPLLEAFETSLAEFVGFDRATSVAYARENELALDPAYFYRLVATHNVFSRVEVIPKRARSGNEMACYRYDVVLQVGAGHTVSDEHFENQHFANQGHPQDLHQLKQLLHPKCDTVVWRRVTNKRILNQGIDPNDIWETAEQMGFQADIAFRPFSTQGEFDVILRRQRAQLAPIRWVSLERFSLLRDDSDANSPLSTRLQAQLSAQARLACEQKLPGYMVPSVFMVIDRIPMTRHGKIDYQRLPGPVLTKSGSHPVPAGSETESRLCRVVEQVLGVTAVGGEDNFFHLGGDSISSIRLISLARSEGIELSAKDVFLAPVIKDLARLSAARNSHSMASDNPVGEFPSTPIMRWLSDIGGLDKQFSQSVMLSLPAGCTESSLISALQLLIDQHAMLRAVWTQPDVIETLSAGSIEARHLFSKQLFSKQLFSKQLFSKQNKNEIDIAELERALTAELNPGQGQLLRACWLPEHLPEEHLPEGDSHPGSLLLVAHHIAVDAVSWQILISDFMTLLQDICNGNPPLPVKQTTSFRSWSQHLHSLSERFQSQQSLWRWHAAEAVTYCFSEPATHEPWLQATAQDHPTSIQGRVVESLHTETLKALGLQIDELLLTALSLALLMQSRSQRSRRQHAIRMAVERHGRPMELTDVDLTRTVGWFTAIHPLRLDTAGVDPLLILKQPDLLYQYARRVAWEWRRIPDGGIGYGVLRYLDSTLNQEFGQHPKVEVGFNYFGRWQTTAEMKQALSGVADPSLQLPHALSVNAISQGSQENARLDINWRFVPGVVSASQIASIADDFHQAITRLVDLGYSSTSAITLPECKTQHNITADELARFEAAGETFEAIWPLTALQQGILAHCGRHDHYRIQLVVELAQTATAERVRQAFDWVLKRHPGLRVSIARNAEGYPFQLVRRNNADAWQARDLTSHPHHFQPSELQRTISEDRLHPIAVEGSSLIRATYVKTARQTVLIISFHHLIADGWSGEVILQDLAAGLREAPFKHRPPSIPLQAYFDWINAQPVAAGIGFWQQHLAQYEPPNPVQSSGESKLYRCQLDAGVLQRLSALSRAHSFTLATLFAGAWSMVLGHHRGLDRMCIGYVSSGRQAPLEGIEKMVGMLVQTVPVCVDLAPASVLDQIQKLQQFFAQMQPHLYTPLSEIQRAHGRGQLFDTLFTYENFPSRADVQETLRVVDGYSDTHYPLSLIVVPHETLELRVQYKANSFRQQEIADLVDRLIRMLTQLVDKPALPLSDVEFAKPSERQQLLYQMNETAASYPDLTLSALFDRQARQFPDATAVIYQDTRLSYAELRELSDRVAYLLQCKKVGPNDVVALSLPRSPLMIAAIIGILKRGASYLPIDPRLPEYRSELIIRDARPRLVVTVADLQPRFSPDLLTLDTELSSMQPGYDLNPPAYSSDCIAHIIYTSGSTGKPKGVMATHRNVVRLVTTELGHRDLSSPGIWTMLHSFAFDFSVFEIWGALATGSSLVMVSEEDTRSPARLLDLVITHQVSVLNITPGSYANLMQAAQDSANLNRLSIRHALVGGEAWSPTAMAAHPPAAHVYNVYGPTECAIFSTLSDPLTLSENEPPLGKFLPNVQGFVLDDALRPCPVGVEGELYLTGDGLTTGYLNQPGLTSSLFIANPFGNAGQRMYRTGDRVVWRYDGQLYFKGRDDNQCKIRGFRIELSEIEKSLLTLEQVRQVTVQVCTTTLNTRQIVAYVVVANDIDTEADLAQQLQHHLRKRLPAYMIPAQFVWLQQLPINSNGKLDKSALPAIGPILTTAGTLAPESPIEIAVCQQLQTLFNRDKLSLGESLIDLGLDSLSAARLAANLNVALGRDIEIIDILAAETVAEVVANIAQGSGAMDPYAEIIPLRDKGDGVPVFCLYPGMGLSWAYTHLLPLFGQDQPVYLIQAPNLKSAGWLEQPGFEAILERAMAAVIHCRPSGPYSLVGWSFGGMLAHCLAGRLQRLGQRIDRLILIDSYPMPVSARPDYADEQSLWRDVALGAGLDLSSHPATLNAQALHRIATEEHNFLARLPLEVLEKLGLNLAHHSYVLPDAELRKFSGDMVFFRAARETQGMDRSAVSADVWNPYISGTLMIFDIDAEHQSMLNPNAVAQMRSLWH